MVSTQNSIRFASFNASLNRTEAGELIADLSTQNNAQAQNVAEIIQRTNPDVLLVNEFDFDNDGRAAQLFRQNYLSVSQNGVDPVEYPYVYVAPSNTGIPAGFDLNNDGSIEGPDDALGFGFFPGQYGMVLYSKHPIDTENIRTFQKFRWQDMPAALLPDDPATPAPQDWYSPAELEAFRLSSKNHWDIPIQVEGQTIHVLASHPTPPTFDGEEDRNGRRNHDEIRFWSDYITPGKGSYIYDDTGNYGGLSSGSRFVIMGDQNADPKDGDSTDNAILQLLDNPLVNTDVTPASEGGPDAAARQGGANDTHEGDPAFDTADFADDAPGNLRVDYVLPSQNLDISEASVFWPPDKDPQFPLVGEFDPEVLPTGFPSSDHRLVQVEVVAEAAHPQASQKTVAGVDSLGEVIFDTGYIFDNTVVGGLSGIAYDPANKLYYTISDDRSQINPARFYTLDINLSDGSLDNGDITFQAVTTLTDADGNTFAESSLDPEGIALTNKGTLFISSEGDASQLINPFINQFSLGGQQFQALPVPEKFLPTASGTSGIVSNLAFESLAITPDQRFLYTATENALIQDGPVADLENGSPARIVKYNLSTGKPEQEFLYLTDAVPSPPNPADGFSNNGLVELLALDNTGTLLGLERSFSEGVGNSIRLYEVNLQGATDISGFDSLAGVEVEAAAQKRLLFDFADLNLPLDNIEGMTFGPTLPDGRQSLVVVSDNNFSVGDPNDPEDNQFTQFLSFALDTDTVTTVTPTVETPQVIDDEEVPTGAIAGDADDPAIYVHPSNPADSLVVTTLKDGGLATFDLEGQLLQRILPTDFGDIRYNNVDLVYGFDLGGQRVDLAVASDRQNDTLAIFQVDPTTRQLIDITAETITESIFGLDDGEQTAYGLATYTSPSSGKSYVFVSQRENQQVAQLELVTNGSGQVEANLVRTLSVPIPSGGELEDAQVEGMVVDRELGDLYVGQENGGIFKFAAEPSGGDRGVLIEAVKPDGSTLEADVEGLTIYYTEDGTGYLLASSQGDNTYAVFTREGSNDYLGSFVVGESGEVDSVEDSDGADVINLPLGPKFPAGLLVVQDGVNEPQVVAQDEAELENISTSFKFVPWENVANAFPDPLDINTTGFDPRNPTPISAEAIALSPIGTYETGVFDEGAAEIVDYDPGTQRLFVVNANDAKVDVLDASDPTNPTKVFEIDATLYGGVANSVAIDNGLVAVAVESENTQAPGTVAFFDTDGNFLSSVQVGALPDMLTFTPDGQTVLVANEGEPSDDYINDPRGSVSVIDLSGGVANLSQADVTTAGFQAFNSQKTALLEAGVRIFGPNASVAQDIEPEYITVSENSQTAWVTLQENNALGVLDIAAGQITDILPLGFKDHSIPDNGLDASEADGEINIANYPIFGAYQPDAIASYEANGETFIITANEGDSRDYNGFSEEASVADLVLDSTAFPNAVELQAEEVLGSLTVTTANGDTDGDGDFDQLYASGTRSFSIWNDQGQLVFDSGDAFEQITASELPEAFNSDNTENNSFDSRSDNKGPEPEGVTTGVIDGRTYAFVGFERIGGVIVYDVTNPASPTFNQYINNRDFGVEFDPEEAASGESQAWRQAGDLGPEGLAFIAAEDSPSGQPLLVAGNEVSGTTTLYEIANVLNGSGGQNTFDVSRGDRTVTLRDFGGVGKGVEPSSGAFAEVDTLQFAGPGLTPEKLLLSQADSDLVIRFAGIPDTEVRLQDFALENLDNLPNSGNLLFDGQTQVEDSFDVFNADQQRNTVFNSNTVTFLNDLDNTTEGREASDDTINAQGGDDTITGLSGDDLLRGGRGFDTLFGSAGKDILRGQAGGDFLDGGEGADTLGGGAGLDQFWLIAEGSLPRGTDRISDFEVGREYIGIAGVAGVDEFADLNLVQQGNSTVVRAADTNLFTLSGVQASSLASGNFIFA